MIKEITTFHPSYTGERSDIVNLIPKGVYKVLDIGCSIGTLGKQLKQRNNAEVIGIESNNEMALEAENNLDKVIIADVEELNFSDYFPLEYFDCIILADILEHLRDPWIVLKKVSRLLNKKGIVIASIPNVRHYTTILNLVVKGIWPYRERGIHDRTHLRFFTLKTIKEMFENSGLKINKIERKYRIIEKPHVYNTYSRYFAFWIVKDFLAFKYIILAEH